MRQDDRSGAMGPGDFTLVDSVRPCAFRFEERFRSVVLQIPRGMLTSRCAAAERITAVPFRATGGPGAFVSAVLRALSEEGRALDEGLARSVTANVLDLLATVCDAHGNSVDAAGSAVHRRDLSRAKEYLDERLHDPGLTLLAVGHALGFSLRYLHQLFQEAGTTPRTWLYDRRLDRARTMLLRRPGHDARRSPTSPSRRLQGPVTLLPGVQGTVRHQPHQLPYFARKLTPAPRTRAQRPAGAVATATRSPSCTSRRSR
ncbi:helix-turn-helix domain-containing protein [Streptomyces montanus]|uniref:Helix-turn-helix domain-containing protein n=1 Tax=Streptomyces montanus TaxID=2580423 RepID=A0A5R9G224_9ACTN|nr:helix-turn-helix domain-containing protein [Streptomyces montanus]